MNRLDSIELIAQMPERVAMERLHVLADDLRALVAVARAAAAMFDAEEAYNEQGLLDGEIDKRISAYDVADESLRDALAPLLEDAP